MTNIKICGFAKVWDVCQIMILKLNPKESWMRGHTFSGKETEDIDCAEKLASRFQSISERMKIFFDVEYKKNSFMSVYLFDKLSHISICNVESLIQIIKSDVKFKEKLLEHYMEEKFSSNDEFLRKVTFDSVNLRSDYKEKLMQFVLFEEEYLLELYETMISFQNRLEEVYINEKDVLNQLEKEFSMEQLCQHHKQIEKWYKSLTNIDVSFSLVQKYVVLGEKNHVNLEKGWMILGIKYLESIERDWKRNVEIDKVCHALSDKVRVKIIQLVREQNEINTANLAKILNLPISATAYHLDVLKKASVLCYRMEGRVAFYWLNNSLLKVLGQKILQLGEER